jgi:hypothetical protein
MAVATRKEKAKKERRRASAAEWANKPDKQFEPTCIKLPEGFEFVKWKEEGRYKYDVMPYVVGKGNPDCDEGYDFFERTYSCHGGLGVEGKSTYFCPAKSRAEGEQEPCYPCQKIQRDGGHMDKELVASIRDKRRIMVNVKDVTDGNHEGKKTMVLVQPFGSTKHPFFGQMLKDATQVEAYQDFWNPSGGMTMEVKVVQDSMGENRKFMKISSLVFVPRKYDYDSDVADDSCCLDDCIIHPDYDEMQNLLEMGGFKPNEQSGKKEETTQRRGRKEEETKTEPDDDDVPSKERTAKDAGLKIGQFVIYKGKECQIIKISGDGTSLTLEDVEGNAIKAISPDKVNKVPVADDNNELPDPDDQEEEDDDDKFDED